VIRSSAAILAPLLALALLTASCGNDSAAKVGQLQQTDAVATQPIPERLVAEPAAGPRATHLTCAAAPWAVFGPAALRRRAGYERRSGAAAVALRRVVKDLAEDGGLPQRGWYVLARRKDRLLFAEGRGTSVASLTLVRRRGRWSFEMSGGCEPRAVRDGLPAVPLRLAFAPDGGNVVRLLVDDVACSSGRDARGRILTPRVWLARKAVTLTVHVRRAEGFQTCQGAPPTPVDVELPEPLGGRSVLVGGALVPAAVTR